MKRYALILLFPLVVLSSAIAENPKLCEDLIEADTSTDQVLQECFKEQGKSDRATVLLAKAKLKKVTESEELNVESMGDDFEIKKFSGAELLLYGKPFYAMRIDNRGRGQREEKRVTKGDALCSYLKYEKALKSVLSPEIYEGKKDERGNRIKVHMYGYIVDTNFLGIPSKDPETYSDEKYDYAVKKYLEITCVRRKDKNNPGTEAALKGIVENLQFVSEEVNRRPAIDSSANTDQRSRKPSAKVPFGYVRPSDMEIKVKGQ